MEGITKPPRSTAGTPSDAESSTTITSGSTPPPLYWLPSEWASQYSHILFINAASSGDMYHIRAAMHYLPKCALVIHSCDPQKPTHRMLETYLDLLDTRVENRVHVDGMYRPTLRTTWRDKDIRSGTPVSGTAWYRGKKYEVTKGVAKDAEVSVPSRSSEPPKSSGGFNFLQMEANVFSEGDATGTLAENFDVSNPPHMTTLNLRDTAIRSHFKSVVDAKYRFLADSTRINVTLFHRDSGSKTLGAHPEFDTGDVHEETLTQLVGLINNHPSSRFNAVITGNKTTTPNSLGEYFKNLDWQGRPEDSPIKGHSNRDIEAAFQKYLHQEYFVLDDGKKSPSFAIGFRSGALDLMSFMLIPTVSIGLREYVGEDRHFLLTKPGFNRLNVQYEMPRAHSARRNGNSRDIFPMEYPMPREHMREITSPWWWYENKERDKIPKEIKEVVDKKTGAKTGEAKAAGVEFLRWIEERLVPVKAFTQFDYETIKTAIWSALDAAQDGPKGLEILKIDRAFTFPIRHESSKYRFNFIGHVVRSETNFSRLLLSGDPKKSIEALANLKDMYETQTRQREMSKELLEAKPEAQAPLADPVEKARKWREFRMHVVDDAYRAGLRALPQLPTAEKSDKSKK